ncbi:hypothetical protein JHK82_044266 [Glycine max]|nr:hypothetical protein JHK86_044614 [Glycine max]KAG4951357.1 hypothetical protein JHK85_045224 [Glycine max]KAG5099214.1 hypothetical protein JHK82_044266 [Glycine max]KAG5107819.1 hypothetical protein JHK84_044726 [Glycine max]KHN27543.1 hypothetical protein glysoja_018655 [Glycine soja]
MSSSSQSRFATRILLGSPQSRSLLRALFDSPKTVGVKVREITHPGVKVSRFVLEFSNLPEEESDRRKRLLNILSTKLRGGARTNADTQEHPECQGDRYSHKRGWVWTMIKKPCRVFWVGDTWMWDFKWRRRWFEWETFLVTTINHMLANVRIQKQGRDSWWWLDDNTGIYSVKYGYRVLHNLLMGSQPTEAFSMIWKLKVPKKVICLVWREYSWIDCQLRTI